MTKRKQKLGILKKQKLGILKAETNYTKHLMIGIPTTGNIRMEWHFSQANIVVPVNWSNSFCAPFYPGNSVLSPLGFHVDHARNICCAALLKGSFEWLLFIDHDVLVPSDLFIKFNQYMESMEYPIVHGLYGTKSCPSDPLIFRGRGNGAYKGWKFGDKVPTDGMISGVTLIHAEIIQAVKDISEIYNDKEHQLLGMAANMKVWKIYKTPRTAWTDPETGDHMTERGTEDLYLADRILKEKILSKTKSWKHMAKRKYPFLCDTSIMCGHIDKDGRVYPMEKWEFAEH